ncbi:hypothetical protein Tco_0370951, partial [Tanacetum coccineum]
RDDGSYEILLRADTPSTSHPLPSSTPPSGTPPVLPIPLPTSSPPLLLPFTDCREGDSEVTLSPQKRFCIALGLRYKVGESSSAPTARPSRGFRADYEFVATLDDEIRRDPERDVGHRIIDTWDEMLVGMPGAPVNDDTELGRRMTNLCEGTVDYIASTVDGDCRVAGSRPHPIGTACGDTNTIEDTTDIAMLYSLLSKMAPKRTTRSTPATTATTTTTVTDAQLKALIDQGVANALAARDTGQMPSMMKN